MLGFKERRRRYAAVTKMARKKQAVKVGADPNPFDELPIGNCGLDTWPCGSLDDEHDLCCSKEDKPDARRWYAVNKRTGAMRRIRKPRGARIMTQEGPAPRRTSARRRRGRRAAQRLMRYAIINMPGAARWWGRDPKTREPRLFVRGRRGQTFMCWEHEGQVRCDQVDAKAAERLMR